MRVEKGVSATLTWDMIPNFEDIVNCVDCYDVSRRFSLAPSLVLRCHDLQQRSIDPMGHILRNAGDGVVLLGYGSEIQHEGIGFVHERFEADFVSFGRTRKPVLSNERFVDQYISRETEVLPKAGEARQHIRTCSEPGDICLSFGAHEHVGEVRKHVAWVVVGLVVIFAHIGDHGRRGLPLADLSLQRFDVGGGTLPGETDLLDRLIGTSPAVRLLWNVGPIEIFHEAPPVILGA